MTHVVLKKIKDLTNKKNVYFTKRCNESLMISVKYLSSLLKKSNKFLLTQEEGGWLTYPKLAKQNGLELVYLKMNNGRIDLTQLKKYSNTILVMHTMPGYSYKENVKKIAEICDKNNILLINDCCGSIGTKDATYGDLIVCSFGKAKPLSCGGGGFIATNFDLEKNEFIGDTKETINLKELNIALDNLNKKLGIWKEKSLEVKNELKKLGFKILNDGDQGINVLVSFNDEKERLIKYLDIKELEFTKCPRYIRTNKVALSIEIKRLR